MASTASTASSTAASSRSSRDLSDLVSVRASELLCVPLTSVGSGAAGGLCVARFDPNSTRPTHVLLHRHTNIDVFQVEWREEANDDGEEDGGDESGSSSVSPFTLRLVSTPSQPLLSCVLQMALLPHTVGGVTRDLLLVTSSSGFLSLLAFGVPNGSSPSSSSPVGPRLHPLGHVRLGAGCRGGLAVGRRHPGCIMRVSPSGHAIVVSSLEAVDASRSQYGDEAEATEGGLIVFPVDISSSTAAATTGASALPNLQSPISVRLDGTVTALTFLPTSVARLATTHVRLLVVLAPHAQHGISPATRAMRTAADETRPPGYPRPPARTDAASASTPQLLVLDISLADGSIARREHPMRFRPGDVVSDAILVTPPNTPATAPPTVQPCFVLLQLADRVVLCDFDARSTLRFPVSVSLPPATPDMDNDNDTDVATENAQSPASSQPPRITCWSWVGDDSNRLVGVSETGEAHFLRFWWNRVRPTGVNAVANADARQALAQPPPSTAPPHAWLRFVSLGLARPASCLGSILSPAFSATTPPADFLLMPGEQTDGMVARVDWTSVDHSLAEQDRAEPAVEDAMQIDDSASPPAAAATAAIAAISTDDTRDAPLILPSSALHRQSLELPNLCELHDFVSANVLAAGARGVVFPSSRDQLLLACGRGSRGSLRIVRPHTIEADLSPTLGDERKVLHALFALRARDPRTGLLAPCALVSSFVGATRLSAVVPGGALEDVTDELAPFGLEATRTTLAAGLTTNAKVIIQVDDRCARAVRIAGAGTETLRGEGAPAVWQPPVTPATSSHLTLAHVHDEYLLLALGATRLVVLLRYVHADHRFEVLAETYMQADVSALHIASVRAARRAPVAAGTANEFADTHAPEDLIFFVGTHDARAHVFRVPSSAGGQGFAASSPPSPLSLCHSFDLPSLMRLPTSDDRASIIAESFLLCSTLPPMSGSFTPGGERFHLFIGLRDGALLRVRFEPRALQAAAMFTQTSVRRLGAAPVRLVRLDTPPLSSTATVAGGDSAAEYLLALTDRPYIVASHLTPGRAPDARSHVLDVREVCWSWRTLVSPSVQVAASFSTVSSPGGLACVVDGRFYFAELDPRTSWNRDAVDTIKLSATPRRLLHERDSNMIVVATADASRDGRRRSQLLLVDPVDGRVIDAHPFDTTTGEVATALALWEHKRARYIVVGTSRTQTAVAPAAGTVHLFVIEPCVDTPDSGASSSSAMDCSDLGTSSASPTPRPTHRLVRAMSLTDAKTRLPKTVESGVLAIAALSPSHLLFSVCGRICLAYVREEKDTDASAASGTGVFTGVESSKRHALVPVMMTRGSYLVPIRDLQVDPKTRIICVADDRAGVSFHRYVVRGRAVAIEPEHTDSVARLARQAIVFDSEAQLANAADTHAHTTAALLPLKHVQMSTPSDTASIAASSVGATSVTRTLGFDAFGSVFMLRREPQLVQTPQTPQTPASVTTSCSQSAFSMTPASSPTNASTSTSSNASTATTVKLPDHVVPSNLVQEAAFLLPAVPSRVRRTRVARIAPLRTGAAGEGAEVIDDESTRAASEAAASDAFLVSSRLGAMHLIREVSPADAAWLRALQSALARAPLTRSMLANHHASYRGAYAGGERGLMIDGEQLAAFFLLTDEQQRQMCATIPQIADTPMWRINAHLHQIMQYQQV